MMSSLLNLGSKFFDISQYTFLTFIFIFFKESFKSAIIILELGILRSIKSSAIFTPVNPAPPINIHLDILNLLLMKMLK